MGKCIADDQLQSEVIFSRERLIIELYNLVLTSISESQSMAVISQWRSVRDMLKRNSERQSVCETEQGYEDSYPQVTCLVRDYWIKMSTFK